MKCLKRKNFKAGKKKTTLQTRRKIEENFSLVVGIKMVDKFSYSLCTQPWADCMYIYELNQDIL